VFAYNEIDGDTWFLFDHDGEGHTVPIGATNALHIDLILGHINNLNPRTVLPLQMLYQLKQVRQLQKQKEGMLKISFVFDYSVFVTISLCIFNFFLWI